MKNFKINFVIMLLLIAIIPITITATLITMAGIDNTTEGLEDGAYKKLDAAAESMRSYFEYDLIHDGYIEHDVSYIDSLQDQDIELTVFEGNTRFLTSILNDKGERNEGTSADEEIYKQVQKGEVVHLKGIIISGQEYYVSYRPMYDKNNQFWGMAFAGTPQTEVEQAINKTRNYMIGALLFLTSIASIIIIIFAIQLKKGLQKNVEFLQDLSLGNISNDINYPKSPVKEFDKIGAAAANLKEALKTSIHSVKDASNLLTLAVDNVNDKTIFNAESVNQIDSTIVEVSTTSQSVAESAQRLSEKTIELGLNIDELTDSVEKLTVETESMIGANNEASKYMNTVLDSSKKTVGAVEQIAQEISDTNDAVKQINKCIAMINEIASETKLLSLNASIEAARAGEAGRGFAVVASNIKQLAESSSENVEKITDIINHVTELSAKSVRGAEKVQTIIEEEQKYITDTQEKFNTLRQNVDKSVEEIANIDKKTISLNEIKQTVTEACTDLGAISEELGASAQEVAAASNSVAATLTDTISQTKYMKLINEDLTSAVSFFK